MGLTTQRFLIKREEKLSMTKQCRVIGLNRSSLYYQAKPYSEDELRIFNEIDKIYTDFPYYGHRKIWKELICRNFSIGRDRTLKYMQTMGLEVFYPKPNTSLGNKQHKIYPYLLKGLPITQPNQVWAADITYIRLSKGFCYLVAIIDWYSRYILSYRISNSLDTSFCVEALEEALEKYPAPQIFNTDQGSQFTSEVFTKILLDHHIQISMDGKGRAKDNIIIERFFRSLKYEDIYIQEYCSIPDLKLGVQDYMQTYNYLRLHESLDYKAPYCFYFKKKEDIFNSVSMLNRKSFLKKAV